MEKSKHSKDQSSDGERKPLDLIKRESQNNKPRLERTRSERLASEKSFDLLKNDLARSSSLPRESSQSRSSEVSDILQQEKSYSLQEVTDKNKTGYDIFEERVHQYIDKYQEKYNSYASNLAEVHDYIEANCDKLAQWQENMSIYDTIMDNSNQAADNYQFLRSDPQRYQQELKKIGDTVTPLQDSLHCVEQAMVDLKKKQDEIRCQMPDLSEQQEKQYRAGEEMLQDFAIVQSWLQDRIQSESITPADKVCIQFEKHWLAHQNWQAIFPDVLEVYKDFPTPSVPLPEVTQIGYLLSNVKQTQKLVVESSECSPELQEKVEKLVETIQQLHEHAIATENQLNEYDHSLETYAKELDQKLDISVNLLDHLKCQVSPDNYSPYSSMDHVISKDGHPDVTFYDPRGNTIATLPSKELEPALTGEYALPSEEQMQTREQSIVSEEQMQTREQSIVSEEQMQTREQSIVSEERRASDHSKDQSRSKKTSDVRTPFDTVRRLLCCSFRPKEHDQTLPSEAPDVMPQERRSSFSKTLGLITKHMMRAKQKLDRKIEKYEKKCISYKSNLEAVGKASSDQLAQWQLQMSEYETILEESKQVLGDYGQLKSDPQRYQQELKKIGDTVTPHLDSLHLVEQEMIDLKKEQDEIFCQTPDLSEQDGEERQQYFWYEKKLHDLALVQSWLQYRIQSIEAITPADKVYIQYEKHQLAHQNWEAIYEDVLARSKACLTPSVQEDGTPSLPEAAEIIQLLRKVKPIQRRVNLCSWWRSPESREKVEELVETIQQLREHAIATKNQLDEYGHSLETYAKELDQKLDISVNLLKDLACQVSPDHYNPYYSMDRVISKEDVEIDSTLPGPCGIKTTRWGLSKLGIDIKKDATEEKIVPLVEYPSINDKKGGVHRNKVSEAYQAYGFDYRYYEGMLNIEEIEHITKQGHVVNVGLYKDKIGGHFLLFEGVTRTENGYHVTFYDPHDSKRVTLPYEELEKVLAGHYTLPSEEQMKTREPILLGKQRETGEPLIASGVQMEIREPIVSEEQMKTREPIRKARVKAKTKKLWSVLACFRARSTGRSPHQTHEA
jgi:predicted  nucleic acid-binding Zn-ribbon protein